MLAAKGLTAGLYYSRAINPTELVGRVRRSKDVSHPNGATTSLKEHATFLFQSTIRICFHERRLQYTEREQMLAWQRARPGERLLEVDVPLSYGMVDVCQPSPSNNSVEFMWDPTKEVGVYIKVYEMRDLQLILPFFFFQKYFFFLIRSIIKSVVILKKKLVFNLTWRKRLFGVFWQIWNCQNDHNDQFVFFHRNFICTLIEKNF